jgi:putative transposase
MGSMGRRCNTNGNARYESFIKTIKVETVYLIAQEAFDGIEADLPHFIPQL